MNTNYTDSDMKKSILMMIAVVSLVALTGCKSTKTAAYHSYATECLGKSMDGRQTLRVWASGRNRADAVEQAKKKAVYDVVFTGISAGGGECNGYPVVDEPNARKKYEDYFDRFFADGGAYSSYVTMDGQKSSGVDKFKGHDNVTYSIVVMVDRSALRRRLENDNIIVK